MFDCENVGVQLRKISLRIADSEDDRGDATRVRQCDVLFRIPVLTHDLAGKIRLPIVAHCFGKDRLPLWGVNEVQFQPTADERYTVTIAAAADMPTATATLALAEVIKVRTWRPNKEKRDIGLEFVTRHELARGDVRDLADVLSAWEISEVLVSLTTVQIPLGLSGEDGESPAASPARGRRTH